MKTYSDLSELRDNVLEYLQHQEGWVSFEQICHDSGALSQRAVLDVLEELTGYKVIQKGKDGQWKAVMERIRD